MILTIVLVALGVTVGIDATSRHRRQAPCIRPALTSLYRLYHYEKNHHVFSVEIGDFVNLEKGAYVYNGNIGYVSSNDRGCGENKLVPMHYLTKNGTRQDHFYTQSQTEVDSAKNAGYIYQSVAFYCSSKADPTCGATLPIERYMRVGAHFYGTAAEGKFWVIDKALGTYETNMCYIWPNSAAAQVV